jgi:recombination protein RecR
VDYPKPISDLIENLTRLPGIGKKTAARLAFYILKMPAEHVKSISDSLLAIKDKLEYCEKCFNFCESSPCKICCDDQRDMEKLCVIETPQDLFTIEKSGGYKGLYHVLHGSIAPLEGIGPDKLKITELVKRIENGKFKEVIIATNPNMEGEATSMYIAKLLKPFALNITRIARGLPIGSDIEYADDMTISKAFEGRVKLPDR